MTCETCALLLDDFVDAALPRDAMADVRRHVGACPDCAALADDLTTIRSLARTLHPLVPPAHVWAAIAQQTRPPERHPLAALLTVWRPAVAAAMSVVLVTSLAWLGGRLTAVTADAPISGDRAGAAVTGFGPYAPEASYTHAIASLEALADARRDALQPAVAEAFDSGMVVIDAAIDQSRAALRTVPNSNVARDSLLQALRTKVVLLQEALALATDRAAANPEMPATAQAETTR